MGVREERREARQRELLATAYGLLATEGVEALTIARIAKEMGASVGGLYRYYPSKEAIFVALQEEAITAFHDWQQRYVARAVASLAESADPRTVALLRVIAAFGAWIAHATAEAPRHRLGDAFLSAPEPLLGEAEARAVDAMLDPILAWCGALLDDAVTAGALEEGNAELRTRLMWAVVHGLAHFRKLDRLRPTPLRVRALTREAFQALLTGWGAPPEALTAALAASHP